MNVLNTPVSYFKTCHDTVHPVTVNLLTYLRSERHRAAVERIRQTPDKAERSKLKERLPGITPSGVFAYRAEEGLTRHSGLLAGDIDFAGNPWNAESIKQVLAGIVNVAYAGLSASGAGVWFLVPIAEPEHHREHFDALAKDFADHLHIQLDPAPANPASFRYYSYDPAAYLNPNAEPYKKRIERRPDTYTPAQAAPLDTNDGAKVESIVAQLEAGRLDITGSYQTWFSILSALANLGEAGRDYAHRVSQFYPDYSTRDTDRQFAACLKMKSNRFTLGTFFELAKQAGVTYKGTLPSRGESAAQAAPRVTLPPITPRPDHAGAQVAQVAPITRPADHSAEHDRTAAPQPAQSAESNPAAFPPGWKLETLTDRHTGQRFELLMTPEGYPAAFDGIETATAPPSKVEANREATDSPELATAAALNPAVWELVARFGLTLEAVEPFRHDAGAAQVEALAAVLAALDLPQGPLTIEPGQSITNPAAFVAGHLEMLRGHAGAGIKAPYRERLEALAAVLKSNEVAYRTPSREGRPG